MNGFTLLWSKTLDSSIWRRESKETRLLWITMLMMKDSEGKILSSKPGLADRANITDKECEESLRVLMGPDANDSSKVDGGRRVREIPGGWEIVNHDLYRFSSEAKREFWRQQKAEQREAEKVRKERRAKKRSEKTANESVPNQIDTRDKNDRFHSSQLKKSEEQEGQEEVDF